MRTSFLTAVFLGFLAVGCAGELSGTGDDTGGDDVQGAVCGNGIPETGEACDDGNASSGDGCSSTCTEEAVPRVMASLDKTSVMTELNTTHMITVSLTGAGGFSGDVNLTGSVTDAGGAPLTGWTVAFSQGTVPVTDGATATAVATVTVPAYNSGLMGTVKIDAASTAGMQSLTSNFTAVNQVTIKVTNNGTQCVYPGATAINVKTGTRLRFENGFQTGNIIIHSNGGAQNIPHENIAGGGNPPGGFYDTNPNDNTPLAVQGTGTFTWYCHSPGPDLGGAGNPRFTVMP
jgi:cysteine-rich repeat protein